MTRTWWIFLSVTCAFGIGFVWGYVLHTSTPSFAEQEEVSSATILFVGDMMFDRLVRMHAEASGYDRIFDGVQKKIQAADIAIGNLEGPITTHSSKSVGTVPGHPSNFTFTFDPKVADTLARAGFDAVSLANNHSTNFGRDGVDQTRHYLSNAGIVPFGNPFRDDVVIMAHDGVTIELIGYSDFDADSLKKTLDGLARSTADVVIVFAHWGEEYMATPSVRQRSLAHQFVDTGADLVVGAHPHVIQAGETYRGVPIYYSLGNFVFDQYWREDVRCGLMVEATFTKQEGVTVLDISTETAYLERDGTTVLKSC